MILDNKYEVQEKLSEGSFGNVFKGKHVRTGELVAVKIEYNNNLTNISSLKNEAKVYQYLSGEPGFLSLKWFSSNDQFSYIVTNLLVCSLTNLIKRKRSLNLTIILQIGIQIIKRIETVHGKYLLHRDIKPDNFMLGSNKQLYLIDFGLCKRYDHAGQHIEETRTPNKTIVGTVNFVSLNVHKGIEPSRRDDVESCIYVLMYLLLNGELPWIKEKDIKKIIEFKEQLTNPTNLLVPLFIKNMLEIVRSLTFVLEPDYGLMIAILEAELLQI